MSIEYDEKGKYYTNVVPKIAVPAIVQTTTHLIRGMVHVKQGERLKDELENGEDYTAVTSASVFDANGDLLYTGSFLAVQKQQIVWIMPVEEDHQQGSGE